MERCEVLSYNKYREVVVFNYKGNKIQMHYHLDNVPEFLYVTKNGDNFDVFVTRKSVNKLQKKSKPKTVETELVEDTVADTKSV